MSEKFHDRLGSQLKSVAEAAAIVVQSEKRAEFLDSRRHVRHPYTFSNPLKASIFHVGGSVSRIKVHATDLSDGGIGFLAPGFVHVGTECHVNLVAADGEELIVTGCVVQCTCLRGQVHHCGVKLDAEIDAESILDASGDASDGVFVEQKNGMNDLPQIEGQEAVQQIIHQLRGFADSKVCWNDCRSMFLDLGNLIIGESPDMPLKVYLDPERIALLDSDGIIQNVNPAWCKFALESGYEGDGYIGTNYTEEFRKFGKNDDDLFDMYMSVLSGANPNLIHDYSCHSSEEKRWYRFSLEPFEGDANGRFIARHTLKKGRTATAQTAPETNDQSMPV